jgi:hypothetical protein
MFVELPEPVHVGDEALGLTVPQLSVTHQIPDNKTSTRPSNN